MSLKSLLTQLAHHTDETFEALEEKLRTRLGLHQPIHIVPYRGFGNLESGFISGRVLRNPPYEPATEAENFLENIMDTYRYVASNEVANIEIELELSGDKVTTRTDDEGYFRHHFDLTQRETPLSNDLWQMVQIRLQNGDGFQVTTQGQLMIPANPTFGVISDIDDTVMQSKATNYVKAVQLLLFNNAQTRLPFPGVAAFYQALYADGQNPIFYVSSSPWNLYPLLTDFFQLQELPDGPLSLMEYGFSQKQFFSVPHRDHKVEKISRVLQTYPALPFILIGDSGQKDPEIYLEIAQTFSEQIRAIYIRDVTDSSRSKEVHNMGINLKQKGVHFFLSDDSEAMAQDAKNQGFIKNLSRIKFAEEGNLPDFLIGLE